ncbi:hypothetical protein [Mesorhizobium sp. ISC15]|uniref:hypothetical protein n=1 Tax=Mesorhizobium sp. ISC15 TaxID=3076429 RepID=UPI00120687A6|nr:MAG: hypothetical protein E5W25_29525 [Mesorhizobium sp.]
MGGNTRAPQQQIGPGVQSVASAMAFLIRRWILHHQTPLSRRFLAQRELNTETGATETALSSSQFNLEHYGLMVLRRHVNDGRLPQA